MLSISRFTKIFGVFRNQAIYSYWSVDFILLGAFGVLTSMNRGSEVLTDFSFSFYCLSMLPRLSEVLLQDL